MRLSLPELALRHPVTVTMVSVSIIALGAIAWVRLPLKFLPDMDFPNVGCFFAYPGATPEQVEREIAIPAEGEFRTIPNLERITTTSSGDGCRVELRFDNSADMATASAEARDRIERLKLVLPEDIDRIFLYRYSSASMPVMALGLFREGDVGEFSHLVRTLVEPRLARLSGVAEVTIYTSVPEPEVLIEFDQERLRTHNVALYQVINMLQAANLNYSVGEMIDGNTKHFVRVDNAFTRPEQIAELVVSPSGLRLKDVAQVGFQVRDEDFQYDIDGKGGAFILIRKESEANTVDTCRAVKDELERIKADPVFAGAEEFVFFDQSDLILSALSNLIAAGRTGGLLAILVLFLFVLRLTPTLIVALAIPTSLVSALVYMFFTGMSLNLVTMMGLIVAVGMLVDNAIVVMENIYRYLQSGMDRRESVVRGASEVAIAITASTVTTIVVFIPVLYLDNGRMAVFMTQFALPVTVSLLASLLGAMTLIPLALSRLKYRRRTVREVLHLRDRPAPRRWMRLLEEHPASWIISFYARCLEWTMRRRLLAVLGLGAVLAATYLFPYKAVGIKPMASMDMRQVDIEVELDQNFDMDMATKLFGQIKTAVNEQRKELGIRNLFCRYSPSGGALEVHLLGAKDLPAGTAPPYTTDEVLRVLSERLPKRLPGAELTLSVPEGGQEGGAAQTVTLLMKGDNAHLLQEYALQLKAMLAALPELDDPKINTERARNEVQLQVDAPHAARAGISPFVIARTVDVALRGNRLPYLKQGGREYAVWAQFQEENRKRRESLDNVAVIGQHGGLVPLNQLVMFSKAESPMAIQRIDGKNVLTLSAKVSAKDFRKVQRSIQRVIDSLELPMGYTVAMGDELEEMQREIANFGATLGLALILIYIVMSALFESMFLPLSILSTIPLAFIGVEWALYAFGTSLDTVGLIGCILLVGVVVNNGIVLVDHINFLRRHEGKDRLSAIIQAGRDRFRPVMMTALTTILGCVPLAIESKTGSMVSFVSLGQALIGGLLSGTLLTLVIVPLFYSFIDDLSAWLRAYAGSLVRLGSVRKLASRSAPEGS